MRVHVLELGWLQWPKGWFRSRKLRQLLPAVLRGSGSGGRADAIPILSYVIEHDDGHIVIDTGVDHALAERVNSSRVSRHVCEVKVEPSEEGSATSPTPRSSYTARSGRTARRRSPTGST